MVARSRIARRWALLGVALTLFVGVAISFKTGLACVEPGWTGDIDTGVSGFPSPEDAVEAWRTSDSRGSFLQPPQGPWEYVERNSGETLLQYGRWHVGVMETDSGGWVVSGFYCAW